MYLKLLTGRNAGEVIDVRADQARQMVADGRAVYGSDYVPAPQSKVATETIVPAKPSRRKRQG